MTLDDLLGLVGARIDAPAVCEFAAAHGLKLPLKPTTDSNDRGSFAIRKLGIEVGYGHDIRLPDFYPPRKEARRYVCHVTNIWFEPAKLTALRPGLAVAASAAELRRVTGAVDRTDGLGRHHLDFPMASPLATRLSLPLTQDDRAGTRWTLSLVQHERLAYLRSSARSHAFTPWDPNWPDEQADLPMGMFMAWAIQRGLVGERHLLDHAAEVEAVRGRAMTGRQFLYRAAFHNELWSWDLAPSLHDFAYRYVHCMCHRNSTTPLLGRADRCGPEDDFMAVFDPLLPGRGLSAADDWLNFDRFAVLLDARFADFGLTGLETELPADAAAAVRKLYAAAAPALAAMPAPIALASEPAGAALSSNAGATAETTAQLLALLGHRTDEGLVQTFCDQHGLAIPAMTGKSSIDAPADGYFVELTNPWWHRRMGPEVAAADQARWQRKKVKLVDVVSFTAAGHQQISHSTGNSVLCGRYTGPLPLGLDFEDDLAAVDARLGADEFAEHDWDTYEGDGTLTRRWTMTEVSPAPAHEAGYVVLIDFERHRLMALRIVWK